MKIDTLTPSKSGLKLFDLGTRKKLLLILCTSILWIATLIAYSIPDFNYWLVASFNTLRTDPLFAGFWYYYTKYMLYVIGIPLSILYLVSFKLNNLKPYRIVFLLAIMTSAIGTPLVDPVMKDLFAVPRPGVLYPDINSLYYVNGFSFPSGHSFQAFAGTLPLIICFLTSDDTFKRNGKTVTLAIILLIFAITLAFSRLFAGVHFLSDVLFGIGFAVILTVILASILQWLLDTGRLNLKNEKWYALIFIMMVFLNLVLIT